VYFNNSPPEYGKLPNGKSIHEISTEIKEKPEFELNLIELCKFLMYFKLSVIIKR